MRRLNQAKHQTKISFCDKHHSLMVKNAIFGHKKSQKNDIFLAFQIFMLEISTNK